MTSMMLLSESDLVATNLSFDEILALVEQTYALQAGGDVEVPTKIGVHPAYPKSFLHAMPAWVGGDAPSLGMKWISYYPGNVSRGLPDSTGVILLNDPHNGQPICMMEGMYITFLRTAACAAVAAKHLVHEPKTLGLVGCGGLGKWSLRFMCHAFPSLDTVYVTSKKPESRREFCETADVPNCRVIPVDHPREAVADSDIVVTSVPPNDMPPVESGFLREGSLFIPLDIVNSWSPAALADFDRFVVDNVEAFPSLLKRKLGHEGMDLGSFVSMQQMIASSISPANTGDRIFVGVCGIASIDIAIAWTMYQRAKQSNSGASFQMR